MSAAGAMELCEQAEACTATAGFIYEHHQDSDKADELCLLLAAIRDARQALGEAYDAVESYVLSLETPRQFEVVGLGLVEKKRSVKRKAWDNDGLWNHVVRYARDNEGDPLALLAECARPSWRVQPLRAIGVQVDEWCEEEFGAESVVLPTRDLDERGTSFIREDVA